MIKGNAMAWDVTKLRPIPPQQIFHHVNDKNICVTKKCEYLLLISFINMFIIIHSLYSFNFLILL